MLGSGGGRLLGLQGFKDPGSQGARADPFRISVHFCKHNQQPNMLDGLTKPVVSHLWFLVGNGGMDPYDSP